jgi:hypothetical protein
MPIYVWLAVVYAECRDSVNSWLKWRGDVKTFKPFEALVFANRFERWKCGAQTRRFGFNHLKLISNNFSMFDGVLWRFVCSKERLSRRTAPVRRSEIFFYWICSATSKLFIQSFRPRGQSRHVKQASSHCSPSNVAQEAVLQLSHRSCARPPWLIWLLWREREALSGEHRGEKAEKQFNSFWGFSGWIWGEKSVLPRWKLRFHLTFLCMSTHGDPFEFVFRLDSLFFPLPILAHPNGACSVASEKSKCRFDFNLLLCLDILHSRPREHFLVGSHEAFNDLRK